MYFYTTDDDDDDDVFFFYSIAGASFISVSVSSSFIGLPFSSEIYAYEVELLGSDLSWRADEGEREREIKGDE